MNQSPPKPLVMNDEQHAGNCGMQMKQKLQNSAEIINSNQFRSDKSPVVVEKALNDVTSNLQVKSPEDTIHIVVPAKCFNLLHSRWIQR
ncbi:hypothetical protein Hdeb2414_s0003g00104311 [Helianthus debilis subsp. tardiflorus]